MRKLSSVEENKDKNWTDAAVLTLIRIWADKGIQGYLDNPVIHLSRSKYFSVNKKISLDRSTLDRPIYLISDLVRSRLNTVLQVSL